MLNSIRNFSKDIGRIKTISSKIEKKLSEIKPTEDHTIDNLTFEELQDLNKLVGIADFMLYKYSDKKELYAILQYFKSVISDTANSIVEIDDEVSELILAAEDSINKVKDMHTNISDKSDFKKKYHDGPDYNEYETSAINLTTFVRQIHPIEYLEKSPGDTK
jgi:hypothetical protein